MTWIKKLLIPNRYDSFYLLVGLLCFVAVVCALLANSFRDAGIGNGDASVLPFSIGICFLAMGSVVALQRHSSRRVGLLFMTGLVLPPFALVAHLWLKQNQTVLNCLMSADSLSALRNFEAPGQLDFERLAWIYGIMLLIPIASWLVFSVLSLGPTQVKTFCATRLKLTRPKVLMGVAGTMLLIGFISNLFSATRYAEIILAVIAGSIGTLILIVAFIAIIYLPTRLLVGTKPGWIKLLFSITLLGLFSAALWFTFLSGLPYPIFPSDELLGVVAAIAAVIIYLLSIGSVLGLNHRSVVENTESDLSTLTQSTRHRFPSIWTIAILLILGGLVWFPFRYDLATTIAGRGLENARLESVIRWKSKGQIRRTIQWGGILHCEFDVSTRPDVLSLLNGDPCTSFVFTGTAPQVDFTRLEKKPGPLAGQFDAGELTIKQFNDFLSQPAFFIRLGGSELIETGQKIDPVFINQLYFVSANGVDPQFAKAMSMFESFENVSSVLVQLDLTREDWPQIIRASQHALVVIIGKLPEELSKEQMALANHNIQLSGNLINHGQDSLTVAQANWLHHSSLTFQLHWDVSAGQPQLFHDLLFAFPNRFVIFFAESFTRDLDFENPALSTHFMFERDETGNPTGLWLPFGESNDRVESLTELRNLSFDEKWLLRRSVAAERNVVDLSRLTKLEHLAFSANSSFERIDFLARMKSLKHLQIPTVDRTSQPGAGFESCPSLETITMLGKPDIKSINEFGRLANLKHLTIVDLFGEFVDQKTPELIAIAGESNLFVKSEFIESLAKTLPGVEVSIVDDKDFSPLLPESFKKYRDEKQKLIQKKLLSEIEAEPATGIGD